jgi:hypothetical protein
MPFQGTRINPHDKQEEAAAPAAAPSHPIPSPSPSHLTFEQPNYWGIPRRQGCKNSRQAPPCQNVSSAKHTHGNEGVKMRQAAAVN